MHTRCSTVPTYKLNNCSFICHPGRPETFLPLYNEKSFWTVIKQGIFMYHQHFSTKAWPLNFIAIVKKKSGKKKKIFSFCAGEPIRHSNSQALMKYLFGWGRFKAGSGPMKALRPFPPLLLHVSILNVTVELVVYKAGCREASHTWAWLQSLCSPFSP